MIRGRSTGRQEQNPFPTSQRRPKAQAWNDATATPANPMSWIVWVVRDPPTQQARDPAQASGVAQFLLTLSSKHFTDALAEDIDMHLATERPAVSGHVQHVVLEIVSGREVIEIAMTPHHAEWAAQLLMREGRSIAADGNQAAVVEFKRKRKRKK